MKWHFIVARYADATVALLVSAWIEIKVFSLSHIAFDVALLVSAWIEMSTDH